PLDCLVLGSCKPPGGKMQGSEFSSMGNHAAALNGMDTLDREIIALRHFEEHRTEFGPSDVHPDRTSSTALASARNAWATARECWRFKRLSRSKVFLEKGSAALEECGGASRPGTFARISPTLERFCSSLAVARDCIRRTPGFGRRFRARGSQ